MAATISIAGFLNKVNTYILNPILLLVFVIAMLYFMWGIVAFIRSADSDKARPEAKKKLVWGLVGMFIMVSAYGLIRLVLNTFDLPTQTNYIDFGNRQ